MTFRKALVAAGAALSSYAGAAGAAEIYSTNFTALNGSGVQGQAILTVNDARTALTVQIYATGLEPGGAHLGHIHGRFSSGGDAIDSVTPPPSADTDGDGFVELAEGVPFYGPIILDFGNVDPDLDGVVNFTQTFDLTLAGTFAGGFDRTGLLGSDLMSLDLREIVLHGLTVGAVGVPPGEVDGTPGYKTVLPVASAEIVAGAGAVPEPGTWALMIGGFGAVGFALRRRTGRATA